VAEDAPKAAEEERRELRVEEVEHEFKEAAGAAHASKAAAVAQECRAVAAHGYKAVEARGSRAAVLKVRRGPAPEAERAFKVAAREFERRPAMPTSGHPRRAAERA
jgi:hypothetical protein